MRSRNLLLLPALACLLAIGVGPAFAGDTPPSTFKGEILDLACYTAHGAKGAEHAACAKKCLAAGQPMGLLAADGTVYLLFASHSDATAYNKAKELAGKTVEIQGEAATQGSVKGITVVGVKAI